MILPYSIAYKMTQRQPNDQTQIDHIRNQEQRPVKNKTVKHHLFV